MRATKGKRNSVRFEKGASPLYPRSLPHWGAPDKPGDSLIDCLSVSSSSGAQVALQRCPILRMNVETIPINLKIVNLFILKNNWLYQY